jgi:hypothetical protein
MAMATQKRSVQLSKQQAKDAIPQIERIKLAYPVDADTHHD